MHSRHERQLRIRSRPDSCVHQSARLFARAQQILPGGVDSPVRAFKSVGGSPLFITRARGAPHRGRRRQPLHRLRDVVGAAHPRPRAARPRQGAGGGRERGTSFGAPSPLEVELGERVARADAVARARALRQLRHRSGDERGARRARGHRTRPDRQVRRLLSRPRRRVPRAGRLRRADARRADEPRRHARRGGRHAASPATTISTRSQRVFDANRDQIAAVIVEPIAGNMGVVPPADGFLRALREICTAARRAADLRRGDLGISRGAPAARRRSSASRPDLTCLGKIIGGGLPVGAYGGRADLMELVSPAGPGLSGGHAVGQSARDDGRALVPRPADAEALQRSLAALGARLAAGLADAARDAGVAAAGQRGRIGADAVLHRSPGARLRVGDEREHGRATRAFFRGMLARGVYPPPSQFEAWFLSAAHTANGRRQDDRAPRGRR